MPLARTLKRLPRTAKRLSIAFGVYPGARWLQRRLRPAQWRAHLADVAFYRQLVPPGALVFDVGANVGEKSDALLSAGARVVAFEPNPRVLPELRARCGRRKECTLVEAAVGSGAAIATLYARADHGKSSLSERWAGRVVATYHVPVVTLDAAVHAFGVPAFCKIDVEGWELEVFRGLTHPLPLLSFEFHLGPVHGPQAVACLRRLAEFGPAQVNVTPAERLAFHFEQWVPLDEFVEWFPGDLAASLPGYPYGDIFVRRDQGIS